MWKAYKYLAFRPVSIATAARHPQTAVGPLESGQQSQIAGTSSKYTTAPGFKSPARAHDSTMEMIFDCRPDGVIGFQDKVRKDFDVWGR